MASFKSVLSGILHFVEKAFSPNALRFEGRIADLLLPQFSVLTDATVAAVINIETSAAAIGKQNGTGEQKAALVLAAIEKQYDDFAAANDIPVIPENKRKYVDAIVAALNSFPAPAAAQ